MFAVQRSLEDQHRVAVAEESVAMLDRDSVGLFDELRTSQSTHQHQQR